MITRKLEQHIRKLLTNHSAVGLLGPRQAGKTTISLKIAEDYDSIYLDLESRNDRNKIKEAEEYLNLHKDKLVILDEIQRVPELFETLRGTIDSNRRNGRKTSNYLILGSASNELLKQSSESLAGRIIYTELGPISISETKDNNEELIKLWNRGGFPESYLAKDDETSFDWRKSFIRTYLERDIPLMGPRIPAETLRNFWIMIAHYQGSLFNASKIAASLGISGQSVKRYLDLLVDLLLIRKLEPWHTNTKKRLVRSPKVYIKDSGILHTLLRINDFERLLENPQIGASWEGFVIENILSNCKDDVEYGFYRTSAGAEIDLVISPKPNLIIAIEIKRSQSPKAEKGFHFACDDLKPNAKFIVYPGRERYPLGNNIEAISLSEIIKEISSLS